MEETNSCKANQAKITRQGFPIVDYLSTIGLFILLIAVASILVIILLSFTLIFEA